MLRLTSRGENARMQKTASQVDKFKVVPFGE